MKPTRRGFLKGLAAVIAIPLVKKQDIETLKVKTVVNKPKPISPLNETTKSSIHATAYAVNTSACITGSSFIGYFINKDKA